MYWNISTVTGGMSTWGWPQNSLVTVDAASKTFRYNHDYYLLKHLTHFVDAGAKTVEVTGTCDDALAFANPDKTVVLLVRNALPRAQTVQVQMHDKVFAVELPADSVSTLTIKPA
jgi:glucosylceramidase